MSKNGWTVTFYAGECVNTCNVIKDTKCQWGYIKFPTSYVKSICLLFHNFNMIDII